MHKVHKLGNAQTDTSHSTYYQTLIKNKSAHSKINNAFWYLASLTRKKRLIKYWSGTLVNQKHAVRFKQFS